MTAVSASPPAKWIHHDEAIAVHLADGEARAMRGDWSSGPLPARAAALQALLIDTTYQMARLQGATSRLVAGEARTETLYIDPRASSADVPAPRRRAARQLYESLCLLAQGHAQTRDFETFAPQPRAETAALPTIAVVAIVVTAGAAVAYLGHEAARVVDRYLSRDQDAQKLMQSHASTLAVIDRHTEREDAAGKQLPLDAASRAALDALAEQQRTLAGKVTPPFGGDLIPTGDASPWDFSTGALVGLAVAAGLWLASKTGVV
jgi:hypothetical protein